ncbi:hypothetical protein GCM10028820_08030 [Tessaracoccus terricola]
MPLILPLLAPLLAVAPVAGVVAGAVALTKHMGKRARERDRVWASWAHARQWGYAPQWPQMAHQFQRPPFGRGRNRTADRGFWGRFDNIEVFGFRYRYTVKSGDSSTTIVQLVTGTRFPGADFPPFTLSREGMFNLGNDVEFENADFNQRWRVDSPSARFAHDVVHPRTMQLLMGPVPPFQQLWFERDALMVSTLGDPGPLQVDAQLRMMTRFAGLLPSFLLREVGGDPVRTDLSGPRVSMAEQQRRMVNWQRRDAEQRAAQPENWRYR